MASVAVFGSSGTQPGTPDWHDAELIGRSLAEAGLTVATGGYSGTMEAVSKGAHGTGGDVVAITADRLFPDRGGANPFATVVRDHPTIAARIADLVDSNDAAIVLPGSIGTATELLVAWNRVFVDSFRPVPKWPLIAVGQPWSALVPQLTTALDTTPDMVTLVATAIEASALAIEILR